MRRLSDRFTDETNAFHAGESVLLTIIPGEQHSFGLSMVAEFFRRAGWNLCTGPFSSHQELASLVQNHWFDIVGFSVSSDRRPTNWKGYPRHKTRLTQQACRHHHRRSNGDRPSRPCGSMERI
jgi:hypothetical protein